MAMIKIANKCRQIRAVLQKAAARGVGPGAGWFQDHVSGCPRCQRRLAAYRRVDLAFSLAKTQPHKLDLLARANTRAIAVLKHSLRAEPKAQNLKTEVPEPEPLEMFRGCGRSLINAAACVAILLLMKIGVLSSMKQFQSTGQKGIRQYYTEHVGEDMAEEIFTRQTGQASSSSSDKVLDA